jgi:fatty acid synthase subunit alpha
MGPTNIVAKATVFARSLPKRMDTQDEPTWADLNGGMDRLPDLADITSCIRSKLDKKADLRRAIARDNSAGFKIVNGLPDCQCSSNFRFDFPSIEATSFLQDLAHLRGLIK